MSAEDGEDRQRHVNGRHQQVGERQAQDEVTGRQAQLRGPQDDDPQEQVTADGHNADDKEDQTFRHPLRCRHNVIQRHSFRSVTAVLGVVDASDAVVAAAHVENTRHVDESRNEMSGVPGSERHDALRHVTSRLQTTQHPISGF